MAGPRVEFLGQVDPHAFFRDLDVLVVPSLWSEPFGLVATEAMAHGVPVLAAARGGLKEIVTPGRDGFLFEPSDPASFLELFDRIRSGAIDLEPMREHALATADRHGEGRIYPRYLDLYRSLLGR
jgi:glycosyltransferase involved in cell wall biosynthesis